MKLIKKIFYFLIVLLLLACIGVVICAFNPDLTKKLAEMVGKPSVPQQESPIDGIIVNGNQDENEKYIVPEFYPTEVPEAVIGLSGYLPVTGDLEQIPQEEADNIGSILSQGELGEGISFSKLYYPYYHMLDENLQKLYRQIYSNAKSKITSFSPVLAVTKEQALTVFEAVYNDHPELYWLESKFSCKYLRTGICVELTLAFNKTVDDPTVSDNRFSSRVNAILEGCKDLATAYEKEKYVHDALLQLVDYDLNAEMNQSAYSALVLGKSVCAGYARAFQYLLQQLEIPCYYCTGYAGADHAWNIVKLGTLYKNADLTWDDTNPATYDYYNKSDKEYASTHVRTSLSIYLPACIDTEANASTSTGSDWVNEHINPTPTEPLTWVDKEKDKDKEQQEEAEKEKTEEEKKKEKLEKAGIREEDLKESLAAYYKDCGEKLRRIGVGEKQFVNVIPEKLWATIEKVYSDGSYREAYVESALKDIGVENFAIQLQAQRLGGGYVKLYHTVFLY